MPMKLAFFPGCLIPTRYPQMEAAVRKTNEVNKRLARIGKEYKGTSRIRHIVTILRDEIGLDRVAQSVKKPLSGVTVAIHYGCHFLKPSRIMNVDNPDHPHILDDLISAMGAAPVKHEERVLCCGRSCQTEETRTSMASTVITSVSASRADLMGMICPTCFTEFDLGQLKLSKKLNLDRPTPPSYLFQLLGIAQGFTPEEMGLGMQKLKPEKLLKQI
ncbi:MAG: hypothetical protein HYU64_01540 [Armatimonadetes bacterium]|nr:hypothetical protein [Armatimonadota bacterium]